ncbi:alginate O-acetyltransferase AlgX-related protein [Massilia consociata]|uniref:Polysaccharide pyruvyl transferase family protein n=1 Tax=Massilia consociata TaxID=760117 RepID=A0ABV6FI24_9BURK
MSDSTIVKPNALPPSSLIGYVDRCDSEVVSGWIVNLANVHDYQTVTVLVDGVEVCSAVANEYREDLAKNPGFAGTAHAYNIRLAGLVADGREHEVTVVESKSKYILKGAPKTLFFPKNNTVPAKHLDVALVGKNGWLFLCHDSNGCIEQYVGTLQLSEQTLEDYANLYEKRQAYLRSRNIYYALAIAPGKEYIYSEYLPEGVKASQLPTVRDRFIAAVNPVLDAPIIDFCSVLLKSKSRGQLCYMNDSHWNYLGAMIASAEIIRHVRAQFPQVPEFDESKFQLIWGPEGTGDLSLKERLDYVNGIYIEAAERPVIAQSQAAIGVEYQVTAREIVEHQYKGLSATRPTRLYKKAEAGNLPRAIIIRDSYADWMIPFLSEHFAESLFIWTRNLDEQVIESFNPDLVLEEVVDRFLITNRAAARVPREPARKIGAGVGANASAGMSAHLYGISSYVPDAAFLNADELSQQSGANTGNFVFCHAISRILEVGPHSNPWGADLSHLKPESDRLVVPLANWLGPHVDLGKLAETFRTVPIPMVGVGLGAQAPISGIDIDAIPEGSWEWLRVVSGKSASDRPNISLRGQATFDAIAKKGLAEKCVVTGCPSNFINPSIQLGKDIRKKWKSRGLRRVAVTAGTPSNRLPALEQSLISLVESTQGIYVCQAPLDMLRLFKGEFDKLTKDSLAAHKAYLLPALTDDEFKNWFRTWAYAYTSVPEWLTQMNQYDVVVGTRIHGVMAGIQGGVPSICICIDSRTLELCQTMKIPHVDVRDYKDGITLDQIAMILESWNAEEYDANRRVLAKRFHQFFRDNDLEIKGAPRGIIKAAGVIA